MLSVTAIEQIKCVTYSDSTMPLQCDIPNSLKTTAEKMSVT